MFAACLAVSQHEGRIRLTFPLGHPLEASVLVIGAISYNIVLLTNENKMSKFFEDLYRVVKVIAARILTISSNHKLALNFKLALTPARALTLKLALTVTLTLVKTRVLALVLGNTDTITDKTLALDRR